MKKSADIVIIGGGITGASIAYHLAAGGVKNVVLLEKELMLGMGSSAASAGIIYHHLPEKINLSLSQKSMQAILGFEEEFGAPIDFRKNGCIQTASTPEDMAALEDISRELGQMGVNCEMLSPGDLAEIFPGIFVADLLGAIFTPDDGYFDPHGVVQAYAAAAKRLGAEIMTRTPAIGIEIAGGRVARVKTPGGDIDTGIVVNAAGPAAAHVAHLAGLEGLPVTPIKRQIFITAPTGMISPEAPFYFDRESPFYFRPESGGILMSIAEMEPLASVEDAQSVEPKLDWASAPILAERAVRRYPAFDSIEIMRGWAGLRSMTPDNVAILGPGGCAGPAPGPEGLYLAVGFCGHGVMHSPMTGKILASMIVGGNHDTYEDIDLAPLRYERFMT
jgi:sarcosine oxidase subunit beta